MDMYDSDEDISYPPEMSELQEDMFGEIEEFLDSKVLCDLTIIIGDHKFEAHKVFMAAASETIREMLVQDPGRNTLVLDSVSPTAMEELLFSVYRDFMRLEEENAIEVVHAAAYLRMPQAMEQCSKYISAPNSETAVQNWHLQKAYKSKGLKVAKESIFKYIVGRFNEIVTCGMHLEMTKDELLSVLLDKDLNVEPEENNLFGIKEWIEHDPTQRAKHAALLFGSCRLFLIPSNQLDYIASQMAYLHENTECRALLQEAKEYHALPVHKKIITDAKINGLRSQKTATLVFGGTLGGVSNFHCWGRQPERPFNNYWQRLPDMRFSFLGSAVTVVNNFMLVSGGLSGLSVSSECCVFDPRSFEWSPISPMAKRRCYFPMLSHGQTVLVFGGCEDTISFTKIADVEQYDCVTNKWEVIGQMPEPLWQHAACKHQNKVYISGGYNQAGEAVAKFHVYDVTERSWEVLPNMNTARSGHRMMAVNDDIFIADPKTEEIEHYSLTQHQWSTSTTWKRHHVGIVKMPRLHHVIMKQSDGSDHLHLLFINGKTVEQRWTRARVEVEEKERKCGQVSLSADPKKSYYSENKYFPEDIRDFLCCSLIVPAKVIAPKYH